MPWRTLRAWVTPSLRPVINATGVILHTNLGRAPLSQAAIQAIQDVSWVIPTLNLILLSGQRGSRLVHAEELLKRLTHAEAALVVNNNAAAVLLVLSALARRRAGGHFTNAARGDWWRVPHPRCHAAIRCSSL